MNVDAFTEELAKVTAEIHRERGHLASRKAVLEAARRNYKISADRMKKLRARRDQLLNPERSPK